ncbi:serine/threonine-protein kinase [Akkermansia muciniphila]|uniref:serine/threonine protein kinase n=1 Tax=Akkermansia muciniphila TaxID=239935 RepID=UPI000B8EAB37|nr:serine/threonine-protein kinase [Akkermansia muciniphila]
MHEAPVFLPPGQKIGPYAIERVRGHGANGIAYLAHDKALDRKVVLKEHYPQGLCRRDSETHLLVPLNEEVAHTFTDSVDQFIREARLIASLEHPSIIKIHRVFSLSPTTCFYVMPLLEGGTLREVIHSGKRIPPRTIISWLQTLVSALYCLNQHHIVHLDIKPGNILFTGEGQPVLADFGTASLRPPHGTVNILAHSAYSAPELFTEDAAPDIRADQYSLAACFYELMTSYPWNTMSGKVGEAHAGELLVSLAQKEKSLRCVSCLLVQNLSLKREERSLSPEAWLTGMNHALHRNRIRKLWSRILTVAVVMLVTGGALTWGLYETGVLTQEIRKSPEDLLVEELLQNPEIAAFNQESREFHDYYSRMFLNLVNKKETSVRKMLETINAARNAEELEQIRQAWRKQQQFDNMTLLAAERVYAIKGKGLAQQYKHLTSPAWFRSWKQNHPGSCSDDVLPPSSPQLLPRIFPHPLHNPSYLSESRLRINAASSNITHALEKKAQKVGIYKISYPNGTPRNPAISDKTNLGSPVQNNGSFKLTR